MGHCPINTTVSQEFGSAYSAAIGKPICTRNGNRKKRYRGTFVTGDKPETAPEPRNYLLRKRGLWWRPDFSGYTSHFWDAGRYTKSEAKSRVHRCRRKRGEIDESVYAIPMKDVVAGIERDLRCALQEAAALAEMLEIVHAKR
jgi:hypothetical protein